MYKFIIIVLLACTSTLKAQQLITGIVADSASFSPLPYVTVKIKNQSKGTATDALGNFSILATQQDTLVLTQVGYDTITLPLLGWEPSVILMPEKITMLSTITIRDSRIEDTYEAMFDEENARLKKLNKSLPFYYSKMRKQKIRVNRLENENVRVETYVNVVIRNLTLKDELIRKHHLSENEYYDLLTRFNEKNYLIMYYLTAGELISLLNNFFDKHANEK